MNPKRVKLACYITNMSMSVVCCLSALLFTTFHRLYNISFASLGLLVFVNYITQLAVDLICTFCSKHFNIEKTVKTIPFITVIGFLIYGLSPFFPHRPV